MPEPHTSVSVHVQEVIISASLNVSMLFNFLMVSKKPASVNRRFVLSAISALHLLCLSQFIVQWYFIDLDIVINGDTRETIYVSTVEGGPNWVWIWRCYHVWGQSSRIILVPVALFVAESCLFITSIALAGVNGQETSDVNARLFNNISSASISVSLGTTMITTFLIGYRIYSASHANAVPSRRLFNRIWALVVESAAVYSLVLLVDSICYVLPSFIVLGSPLVVAGYYVEPVLVFVTNQGMAPTVLVARIALTNPSNPVAPTVTHISGLQFGSQHRSGGSRGTTGGEMSASVLADDATPEAVEMKRECTADGTIRDDQTNSTDTTTTNRKRSSNSSPIPIPDEGVHSSPTPICIHRMAPAPMHFVSQIRSGESAVTMKYLHIGGRLLQIVLTDERMWYGEG
ncbi:hypothetical protein CVT25_013306 [Psilocybe cyanescens]|uniref:Uncharacterized protein n=1 Tax=Psilocybe cyanescens TaxID=93625 RepID=A0A409XWQ1_PSICY|nr:hypothetical protein CVT25_013306 [Psilocybe cyanescens]